MITPLKTSKKFNGSSAMPISRTGYGVVSAVRPSKLSPLFFAIKSLKDKKDRMGPDNDQAHLLLLTIESFHHRLT